MERTDKENENKKSGFGTAAAVVAGVVGVGIGAALYYFANKQQETPQTAGSSAQSAYRHQQTLPVTPPEPVVDTEMNKYKVQMFRERSWTLEECSICFEVMMAEKLEQLPCGHKFHSGCVKGWLQEHHTCPNCRKTV